MDAFLHLILSSESKPIKLFTASVILFLTSYSVKLMLLRFLRSIYLKLKFSFPALSGEYYFRCYPFTY